MEDIYRSNWRSHLFLMRLWTHFILRDLLCICQREVNEDEWKDVFLRAVWYIYLYSRRKLNVTSLEISGGLKVVLTFWLNEKSCLDSCGKGKVTFLFLIFFCKTGFFCTVSYRHNQSCSQSDGGPRSY